MFCWIARKIWHRWTKWKIDPADEGMKTRYAMYRRECKRCGLVESKLT